MQQNLGRRSATPGAVELRVDQLRSLKQQILDDRQKALDFIDAVISQGTQGDPQSQILSAAADAVLGPAASPEESQDTHTHARRFARHVRQSTPDCHAGRRVGLPAGTADPRAGAIGQIFTAAPAASDAGSGRQPVDSDTAGTTDSSQGGFDVQRIPKAPSAPADDEADVPHLEASAISRKRAAPCVDASQDQQQPEQRFDAAGVVRASRPGVSPAAMQAAAMAYHQEAAKAGKWDESAEAAAAAMYSYPPYNAYGFQMCLPYSSSRADMSWLPAAVGKQHMRMPAGNATQPQSNKQPQAKQYRHTAAAAAAAAADEEPDMADGSDTMRGISTLLAAAAAAEASHAPGDAHHNANDAGPAQRPHHHHHHQQPAPRYQHAWSRDAAASAAAAQLAPAPAAAGAAVAGAAWGAGWGAAPPPVPAGNGYLSRMRAAAEVLMAGLADDTQEAPPASGLQQQEYLEQQEQQPDQEQVPAAAADQVGPGDDAPVPGSPVAGCSRPVSAELAWGRARTVRSSSAQRHRSSEGSLGGVAATARWSSEAEAPAAKRPCLHPPPHCRPLQYQPQQQFVGEGEAGHGASPDGMEEDSEEDQQQLRHYQHHHSCSGRSRGSSPSSNNTMRAGYEVRPLGQHAAADLPEEDGPDHATQAFEWALQRLLRMEDPGWLTQEPTSVVVRSHNNREGVLVTKQDLIRLFHVPLEQAADMLGVKLTVFKKHLRSLDITRWPHRKFASLGNAQGHFSQREGLPVAPRDMRGDILMERKQALSDAYLSLLRSPNTALADLDAGKHVHASHKQKYKQKKRAEAEGRMVEGSPDLQRSERMRAEAELQQYTRYFMAAAARAQAQAQALAAEQPGGMEQ